MSPREEQEIVEECRSNPSAFGKVFDYWYKPVFGYIIRRVGDYDVSRDIAAETFLKAHLNIANFRWKGIGLSSWIYRIATNEINLYYRKNKYKPQSLQQLLEDPQIEKMLRAEEMDEKEIMENELKAHDLYNKVRSKLPQLDIKYQEVISLRYFEQKTNKEVSEILNKNEGTVKSLLSRGLEKLRKLI